MADTTYTDGITLLTADTMNDLNRLHYTILNDPADAAAVKTALSLGTASSPQFTAIELGHATDTTISRASAGVVAVEGVNVLTVAGGTLTGVLAHPDGSAAAPSITHSGDTDCGFFFPAADTIAASIAGAEAWRVNTNGFGLGMTPGVLSGNRFYINNATVSGSEYYVAGARTGYYYVDASQIQIGSVTSIPVSVMVGNSEKYKFGTSGQFGIGGATYGNLGEVFQSAGASAAPTWSKPTTLHAAAAVAVSSGTTKDFGSIPSGVREINVMLSAMSTSDTNNIRVQIGTGGTPQTTGYTGCSTYLSTSATFSSGFAIPMITAGSTWYACVTLRLMDSVSNIWHCTIVGGETAAPNSIFGGGVVALSGVLDIVRLITTTAFDGSGTANVSWQF